MTIDTVKAAPMATVPTPFVDDTLQVLPDWIDSNGHMNVAGYLKAFDEGFAMAYDWLGLSVAQIALRGLSSMTAEVSISYRQELFVDAPLRITTQLIACDPKRAHWMQAMYHRNQGFLAATAEWLVLHIDMHQRRVSALPADCYDRLQAVRDAHAKAPLPAPLGRSISLANRRPLTP